MLKHQYILTSDDHIAPKQMGGKGSNLIRLVHQQLRVPPFIIIPHDIVNDCNAHTIDLVFNEIKDFFTRSINQPIDELRFAVRSSAINEDGLEASFAGQYLSILNANIETLTDDIIKVKKSVQQDNVKTYTQTINAPDSNHIAVIVQLLIDADVSGVAFGINPIQPDSGEKIINALYGLGEGLVSGKMNADTFIVDPSGKIKSIVVHKSEKIQALANRSGTETVAIESPLADYPSLDQSQIIEIAKTLDRLEHLAERPQDLEFCISSGQIYYLQTRPITGVNKCGKDLNEAKEKTTVWDNSNIIESYPGHTLPLTFSFIRKMYEAVYSQLLAIFGIHSSEISGHQPILSNMLGLIHGRVYYNLLNWYRILALIPGFSLNASYMEKMMGVKESIPLEKIPTRSKSKEIFRIIRLIFCLLSNLSRLNRMRKEFEAEFESVMTEYSQIDYSKKSLVELQQLYEHYEQTLLKKWKAPMVNDFFVMIFFSLLQKLIVKYGIDTSGTLHNDLLGVTGEVLTTEPIKRTIHISALIKSQPKIFELFLKHEPNYIYTLFTENKLPSEITISISEYLSKWGDRTPGELKLETITYRQKPEMYIKQLQSYLRQDVGQEKSIQQQTFRIAAETIVANKLKYSPVKRTIFTYILRRTKTLVSGRESMRFARTRGYGVVRSIFSAIGQQFYNQNWIEFPADIFYLTQDEIIGKIEIPTNLTTLSTIVEQRKNKYKKWYADIPLPERFTTYGQEGIIETALDLPPDVSHDTTDTDIAGTGCSPGVVKAKVRVVKDPNEADDLCGDILVSIHTDPGWVTLFPTASAIIVEKGSLLSHSAIVSREMGIPCIVGVRNATHILKTGMEIEMNGRTGHIKILSHEPS